MSPGHPNFEGPTYNGLAFFPTRPGLSMDVDLFLKMKGRLKRAVVEQKGLAVSDEATALLVNTKMTPPGHPQFLHHLSFSRLFLCFGC